MYSFTCVKESWLLCLPKHIEKRLARVRINTAGFPVHQGGKPSEWEYHHPSAGIITSKKQALFLSTFQLYYHSSLIRFTPLAWPAILKSDSNLGGPGGNYFYIKDTNFNILDIEIENKSEKKTE